MQAVDLRKTIDHSCTNVRDYGKSLASYLDKKSSIQRELRDLLVGCFCEEALDASGKLSDSFLPRDQWYTPIRVTCFDSDSAAYSEQIVTAKEFAICLAKSASQDDPTYVALEYDQDDYVTDLNSFIRSYSPDYANYELGLSTSFSLYLPYDCIIERQAPAADVTIHSGYLAGDDLAVMLGLESLAGLSAISIRRSPTSFPKLWIHTLESLSTLTRAIDDTTITITCLNTLSTIKEAASNHIYLCLNAVLGDRAASVVTSGSQVMALSTNESVDQDTRLEHLINYVKDGFNEIATAKTEPIIFDPSNSLVIDLSSFTGQDVANVWSVSTCNEVFNKAVEITSTVLNAAGKVICAAVSGIFNWGKRLWRKYIEPAYESRDFQKSSDSTDESFVDIPSIYKGLIACPEGADASNYSTIVYDPSKLSAILANELGQSAPDYQEFSPTAVFSRSSIECDFDSYSLRVEHPDSNLFRLNGGVNITSTRIIKGSSARAPASTVRWWLDSSGHRYYYADVAGSDLDHSNYYVKFKCAKSGEYIKFNGNMGQYVKGNPSPRASASLMPAFGCIMDRADSYSSPSGLRREYPWGDAFPSSPGHGGGINNAYSPYIAYSATGGTGRSGAQYCIQNDAKTSCRYALHFGGCWMYFTHPIQSITARNGFVLPKPNTQSGMGTIYEMGDWVHYYCPLESEIHITVSTSAGDFWVSLSNGIVYLSPAVVNFGRVGVDAYSLSTGLSSYFSYLSTYYNDRLLNSQSVGVLTLNKPYNVMARYVPEYTITLPGSGWIVSNDSLTLTHPTGRILHVYYTDYGPDLTDSDDTLIHIGVDSTVTHDTGDFTIPCDRVEICFNLNYQSVRRSDLFYSITGVAYYDATGSIDHSNIKLNVSPNTYYSDVSLGADNEYPRTEWVMDEDDNYVGYNFYSMPLSLLSNDKISALLADVVSPIDVGCACVMRRKFITLQMFYSNNKIYVQGNLCPVQPDTIITSTGLPRFRSYGGSLQYLQDNGAYKDITDSEFADILTSACQEKFEYDDGFNGEDGDLYAYRALCASKIISYIWLKCFEKPATELIDLIPTTWVDHPVYSTAQVAAVINQGRVTNSDYLSLLFTGLANVSDDCVYGILYSVLSNKMSFMRIYRAIHEDYPSFVPYIIGDRCGCPLWHINTDQENKEYAEKVAAACIIAAAVIAASVIIGVVSFKVVKALKMRKLNSETLEFNLNQDINRQRGELRNLEDDLALQESLLKDAVDEDEIASLKDRIASLHDSIDAKKASIKSSVSALYKRKKKTALWNAISDSASGSSNSSSSISSIESKMGTLADAASSGIDDDPVELDSAPILQAVTDGQHSTANAISSGNKAVLEQLDNLAEALSSVRESVNSGNVADSSAIANLSDALATSVPAIKQAIADMELNMTTVYRNGPIDM